MLSQSCLLIQSSCTMETPVLCGAILVSTHSTPGGHPGAGRFMQRPHATSSSVTSATLPVDSKDPCPTPALQYSALPCSAFHMDVGNLNSGPHVCGAANTASTVPSPSCSLQFWARVGAVEETAQESGLSFLRVGPEMELSLPAW